MRHVSPVPRPPASSGIPRRALPPGPAGTSRFRLGPVCGIVLVLAVTGFQSADDLYRTVPAPAWVAPATVTDVPGGPAEQIAAGLDYLLVDRQIRVEDGERSTYFHLAYRVVNTGGLENASTISVDFDPTYQRLDLHFVRVVRSGEMLDRLDPERVSLLQRETSLEAQIYDGTQTAALILEDVRVGDIVEYAYTRHGANPIFEGRFSTSIPVQAGVPLHRFRTRILWQVGEPIYIRNDRTDVQPTRRRLDGYTEYVWALDDVPALLVDSHLPVWYDPYPGVQVSAWASWAEVVAWGRRLFEPTAPDPEALLAEVRAIEAVHSRPEERVRAALRFAQDEIRYMGIEIGTNSHEPHRPDVVLKRRFGDCKDKTLLLVSLLRRLGIEAWPALVNTDTRQKAAEGLPTPGAFDHVIAYVQLGDAAYWLDPTNQYQRGRLDRLAQADYGAALILRPGETGFTPFPEPRLDRPTKEVTESFDLSAGPDEDVAFTVTTVLRGADADGMRAFLASRSRQDVERMYETYYGNRFPAVARQGPLAVQDDESENEIEVVETYTVSDFWAEEDMTRTASFYPQEFGDLIATEATARRTMPLGTAHPLHEVHTIEVLLPEPWPIEPEELVIEDTAFTFEQRITYAADILRIIHVFRTHADHVPAAASEAHLANLDRVEDELGYELYTMSDAATSGPTPNWLLIVFALAGAVGLTAVAQRVYRHDPAQPPLPPDARDPNLQGFGGWLIPVGFAVVTTPLRQLATMAELDPIFRQEAWQRLTSADSAFYDPLFAPLLVFEMLGNLALFVFALLAAVLFFQRRQSFPKIYILYMIGALTFSGVDQLGTMALPGADDTEGAFAVGLMTGAVSIVVWTAYFKASRRVASTFVRRFDREGKDVWRPESEAPYSEEEAAAYWEARHDGDPPTHVLPRSMDCTFCDTYLVLLPEERIEKRLTCPECGEVLDFSHAAEYEAAIEEEYNGPDVAGMSDQALYAVLNRLEDYRLPVLTRVVDEVRARALKPAYVLCSVCDRVIVGETVGDEQRCADCGSYL